MTTLITPITAREAFRLALDRELGGEGFSQERRIKDAALARRCRNLFFRAVGPSITNDVAFPPDLVVQAQTLPFGNPTIVIDVLSFDERYVEGFFPGVIWQLMRVFTSGVGVQDDFFGAGNFLASIFTLGHYQSNVTANWDAPSTKTHFMPYLLRTGEIFQVNWEFLDVGSSVPASTTISPEADFRALRVLKESDPYGQLCGRLKDQVCGYVKNYQPETFVLDLEILEANFPPATETRVYTTPLQERPLLIYAIGTNLNGAQIQIRDSSTQHEFCASPQQPTLAIDATGAPVAGDYPSLQGVPINCVAGNGDLTYHEAYNYLPVPHLLAPNEGLTIRLTNGLRPTGVGGAYAQSMNTISNLGNSTGPAHLAFLCRTV